MKIKAVLLKKVQDILKDLENFGFWIQANKDETNYKILVRGILKGYCDTLEDKIEFYEREEEIPSVRSDLSELDTNWQYPQSLNDEIEIYHLAKDFIEGVKSDSVSS